MGFLEATPVGRVLNRFSRDTSMLDSIVYSMMDNFATVAGWCAHAHARERKRMPWGHGLRVYKHDA